jgi:predicted O-methyltransferase YrrM
MSQRQPYSDIMAAGVASPWQMDLRLAQYIDELYEQGRAHDAEKPDRLDRLRNLEPDTARLLAVLVRATGARRLLEIGTSNGFSTLWLADAARSIDGRVVSVELDPARGAQALAHLSAVQLDALVELRTEDAAQTLKRSADAAWDMIFLDAERPAYVGYWPELLRVLKGGGLLVVDNVLSHAEELRDFRQLVAEDPRVSEALAPTGAGALLIVKEAATVRS